MSHTYPINMYSSEGIARKLDVDRQFHVPMLRTIQYSIVPISLNLLVV